MERVRLRYLFVVAGYVVMPEHVHLLVNEPARAFIQGRSGAQIVRLNAKPAKTFLASALLRLQCLRAREVCGKTALYPSQPGRRGLVEKPEDWQWSSFRHYQTGMHRTVEIESEWTARERGWQLPEWMLNRRSEVLDLPGPQMRGTGGTIKLRFFRLQLSFGIGAPALSSGCRPSRNGLSIKDYQMAGCVEEYAELRKEGATQFSVRFGAGRDTGRGLRIKRLGARKSCVAELNCRHVASHFFKCISTESLQIGRGDGAFRIRHRLHRRMHLNKRSVEVHTAIVPGVDLQFRVGLRTVGKFNFGCNDRQLRVYEWEGRAGPRYRSCLSAKNVSVFAR